MEISKYTLFKLALSGAMVMLAIVCALLRRTPYVWFVLIGMVLGFAGDLCLAKLPWVVRSLKDPFLTGMGAFALGHVCYIVAFCATLRAGGGGVVWWVAFVELAFALIIWVLVKRAMPPGQGLMAGLLLIYVLLITAMASLGASLSLSSGVMLPLMGGMLFLVSDSLIALNDFGRVLIPRADTWIWATYVPAQLCVVAAGFWV